MAQKFWPVRRVVVYNFASGFGPVGNCKPNQNPLPGFVFVYTVPDLIMVLKQIGRGPARVCFSPLRTKLDKKEIFGDVSRLVADFSERYGATTYAVDEVWNGQTSSWSPESYNECFLQWRHYDLTPMWTSQQPQAVDQSLRSVSTEIYCGRLIDLLDIKAVQKCGLPPAALEKLPQLPNRVFVHRLENREWRIER